MLDVRRMRVLREVAQRGSFSAAAEALSFTQSAVSQQIAALERETGAVLVDRSARGVRLTDAGRALVCHTDAILARLSDAEAELDAIAGLRGGRLRLVAFPSAAASIMPPAIARFGPRIAFQSDDYLAIQGFVAAGVGVCLIPDLALISVRDDVVIRSLGAKPPFRRILAGTTAEGYQAPATQAMVDILVDVSR